MQISMVRLLSNTCLACFVMLTMSAFKHRAQPSTANTYETRETRELTPANPDATWETRELLIYLRDIGLRSDHRVLTGQHIGEVFCCAASGKEQQPDGYNRNWVALFRMVGVKPAIMGIDLNDHNNIGPASAVDYSTLISEAQSEWAAGSIIEVTWHAKNPWTGGQWNDNRGCSSGDDSLADIANPSKPAYAKWHAQVDAIDNALLSLKDSSGHLIPVIWRPFAEANNAATTKWWWAGGCNPTFSREILRTIWRDLFNYQRAHGVNNLAWAYTPSNPSPGTNGDPYDMYPGNDLVDLIGLDDYHDATSPTPQATYPEYSSFISTGKTLIYGERGPHEGDGSSQVFATLIPGIMANTADPSRPVVSSFMAWINERAIVNNPGALTLLRDPNAANQKDSARFWKCARRVRALGYTAVEACVLR